MHLAQINIGRLLYPKGDPRAAEFFDNLDRVNAAADRMPGFVWRLKDDTGNATSISAFADPAMLLNMSVWESAEALEKFVWQTVHARFYRKREALFEMLAEPHFAMWWIEPGHIPTPDEGRERVQHLQRHGPSDYAFGWADLPGAKLWQHARCA